MIRLARIRLCAVAAAAAATTLPLTAVVPSAAHQAPAAKDPPAAEATGLSAGRVLPELDAALLDLDAQRATASAGLSNASLLLDKDGYRPLPDVRGALQTTYLRNNNRGQVVGTYAVADDDTVRLRGFVRRGRNLTRIDVPDAIATVPVGVNDRGRVVGAYVEADAPVDPATGESLVHGFVWAKGRTRTFDVPGSISTAPYEINNRGQIVGNFADARGVQHGFLASKGKFTTIDHPDATDDPSLTGTRVIGINDRGQLVGSYGNDRGIIRAWAWKDGRFTTIHPRFGRQSEASQIDSRGRIVGRYLDPNLRSFLLERGRYTRFDVPNRCDTAVLGLNDRGQILIAAAGTTDGTTCPPVVTGNPQSEGPVFVLEKGRFSAFDAPGISANELLDVNDRGQVAGTYVSADSSSHGFVRNERGRVTRFDAPGAVETYVSKINDRGQVIGVACAALPCRQRGYLRQPDGSFRTIRVPRSTATQAFGLDDRGRIVGDYLDRRGIYHGYLWAHGRFTTIDVPGAAQTTVTGLNNRGDMVGLYTDADGTLHGYFRDRRGRITTIDTPGVPYTLVWDVNDRRQVVGFTVDALPLPDSTDAHGFVFNPRTGDRTSIDVPGAPRTIAFGISDRGSVVGIYENPNAVMNAPQSMRDALPLALGNEMETS